MIVVLDTNVIISALLSSKGTPARIIDQWQKEVFTVATSPPLLEELERVLLYPRVQRYLPLSDEELEQFLGRVRQVAIIVEPEFKIEEIDKDPSDNRLLECAVESGAAFIVSGDEHLLNLGSFEQTIILNPNGFLAVLQSEEKKD